MWELDCDKAEHWRIDAFELWCWRRLLRVPWTAKRSNQSILKEISLGCSLEGMMLKLKLQYFGHLMRRVDWKRLWCWEGLGAGGEGYDRGWDGWMSSPTRRTWVWVNSAGWWWAWRPGVLQFMGLERVGQGWVTELNWRIKLIKSNHSIIKEISPEYSLERLMLKLKFQYFGHLMQRINSLEKMLMLGKIEGRRRRGRQRMRWFASLTQWIWASSGSLWWTGKPGCSPWGCKESDATECLNWTELYQYSGYCLSLISLRKEIDGLPE